jgi:hypothetical protein
MGERMYRSTFSWPLYQLEVSGDSRPGRFTPGTHCIWGWVGPRTGLDDMEKRKFFTLPGLELRPTFVQSIANLYTDWAILTSF